MRVRSKLAETLRHPGKTALLGYTKGELAQQLVKALSEPGKLDYVEFLVKELELKGAEPHAVDLIVRTGKLNDTAKRWK